MNSAGNISAVPTLDSSLDTNLFDPLQVSAIVYFPTSLPFSLYLNISLEGQEAIVAYSPAHRKHQPSLDTNK